jgi:radical SAM protein with 4Fe4S-binding SPASM domain
MSCTIPGVPINVVGQRITSLARAERIPLSASIEIIATCNFRCEHCYIAPNAERHDVMSLADCERVFDDLQRAGTLYLTLTGGEVFTHKQFREIYLAAVRRGFLIAINTNAYLIGEKWADFLAEYPPEVMSISVYGLSDEQYERVTGIPRGWTRVARAIELLRERGIRLDLKCPALKTTAADIPRMAQWARDMGQGFRYDATLIAEEKGSYHPLSLQLTADEVLKVDEGYDPEMGHLRDFVTGMFASRSQGPARDDRVYLCGAGRTALHVNVHGDVHTCSTSRRPVANLFRDGWEHCWAALGGKVAAKLPDGHPCATCKFRFFCVGCPATAESITGLPTGYVQAHCKITHARAHRFGLHPTGTPRTVAEGIPHGVPTPPRAAARMLPVIS